jgi:hypothetical protein
VINVQACAEDSRPCRQIVQFVINPCVKAESPTFALSLISVYTWQLSIYDCNNFPCIHTLLTLLYVPPYLKIIKTNSAHAVHFCLNYNEKNQHSFTYKTIINLFHTQDAVCSWHVIKMNLSKKLRLSFFL